MELRFAVKQQGEEDQLEIAFLPEFSLQNTLDYLNREVGAIPVPWGNGRRHTDSRSLFSQWFETDSISWQAPGEGISVGWQFIERGTRVAA
jgi:hypothetical protein